MLTQAITLSGLAVMASAHILMTNPAPYGKSSLNNSPLLADGSDFPCKQRSDVYSADGVSNVYAQGSKQQLEFQGSAVHGGGSCQVSVTSDMKPTKDSVWKVIKSIEGGCPAKNQGGNMGDNAKEAVPFKYDFTIPDELATGNYTLAWTWFNKIGNREMYMNCAPVSVTGSGGSKDFINTLPDMLVANIGNQCTVPDSKDVQFPNPGQAVERFNGQTSAFGAPTGAGCQKGSGESSPTSASSAGGGGGYAPVESAASSGQESSATPASSEPIFTATTISISSLPGGVFATSSISQPTATQVSSSAISSVPAKSTTMVSVPTPAPSKKGSGYKPEPSKDVGQVAPHKPAPPASSGSSGSHAVGAPCSIEGQWNCVGGGSFQRCASGAWSVVQSMAAGVSCESGESANLKLAGSYRRAPRRAFRLRAD